MLREISSKEIVVKVRRSRVNYWNLMNFQRLTRQVWRDNRHLVIKASPLDWYRRDRGSERVGVRRGPWRLWATRPTVAKPHKRVRKRVLEFQSLVPRVPTTKDKKKHHQTQFSLVKREKRGIFEIVEFYRYFRNLENFYRGISYLGTSHVIK